MKKIERPHSITRDVYKRQVQKDEGLFGYQAVRRLMRLMEAALDGDTVWE